MNQIISCSEWIAGVIGYLEFKIRCSFSKKAKYKEPISQKEVISLRELVSVPEPCGPLIGKVCHRHQSLTTMALYIIKDSPHDTTPGQRIQFIKKSTHKTFSSNLHMLPIVLKGEMLPQMLCTTMLLLNWKLRTYLAI